MLSILHDMHFLYFYIHRPLITYISCHQDQKPSVSRFNLSAVSNTYTPGDSDCRTDSFYGCILITKYYIKTSRFLSALLCPSKTLLTRGKLKKFIPQIGQPIYFAYSNR